MPETGKDASHKHDTTATTRAEERKEPSRDVVELVKHLIDKDKDTKSTNTTLSVEGCV